MVDSRAICLAMSVNASMSSNVEDLYAPKACARASNAAALGQIYPAPEGGPPLTVPQVMVVLLDVVLEAFSR